MRRGEVKAEDLARHHCVKVERLHSMVVKSALISLTDCIDAQRGVQTHPLPPHAEPLSALELAPSEELGEWRCRLFMHGISVVTGNPV